MEFLLLVYEDERRAAAFTGAEREREYDAYRAYTRSLVDAGVLRAGNALMPTTAASNVRRREGEALMLDGPFAETKEQLAGYYLIDCSSAEEARIWASKMPAAATGTVEVRPILNY